MHSIEYMENTTGCSANNAETNGKYQATRFSLHENRGNLRQGSVNRSYFVQYLPSNNCLRRMQIKNIIILVLDRVRILINDDIHEIQDCI